MFSIVSKKPRSVDDFVNLLEDCISIDALFLLYQDEIEREGYQNIVFARLGGAPSGLEVPFGNLPESFVRTYLEGRLWENDPIRAAAQTSARPFTWIDEMVRKSHSEAAYRVMQTAAELGVRGGLTLPFHQPGGRLDLFSLSMRDKRMLNAHRIDLVNIKTYATLQRYLALVDGAPAERHKAQAKQSPLVLCCDGMPGQRGSVHPQHGAGFGPIGEPECSALVLVDIAWRRYSAGFINLNRRIPEIIGEGELKQFIDRGLIEEEPDDERFRFFLKPSPMGHSHLKLCPHVSATREEVWRHHIEKDERPDV